MKILILGGTIFLGPHLIEAALARGHQITIFNRGRHDTACHPEVERLRGDRTSDVEALRGRRWDAAIDTCGYVPEVVRKSAELLANAVEHYTFISSVSVYANFELAGTDEDAPVKTITSEQVDEAEKIDTGERATAVTYGSVYGALKALCEQAAEQSVPGRVLNVRAGLVVGPGDYSDRFTYWVHRVAQGGEVLAPGRPGRRVRVMDCARSRRVDHTDDRNAKDRNLQCYRGGRWIDDGAFARRVPHRKWQCCNIHLGQRTVLA